MTARSGYALVGAMWICAAACGGSQQTSQPQPAAPETAAPQTTGYQAMTVTDGGRLTGTISVTGSIPTLPARAINKDARVCGTGSRPSEALMVSKAGGLKNAVVIVQGVPRGKAMPAISASVDQTRCEYVPHVQVMPANADISIVNRDPILHNIHFYRGDEDLFNIAQPIKGQTNAHKIEKAGFVYAECDVHGWMKGHVAVVDNPYFAVTDDSGHFSMTDVPAGSYAIVIWHEYLGEQTQTVTVAPHGDAALNVDLKDLLATKQSAAPASAPTGAMAGKPLAPAAALRASAGKPAAPAGAMADKPLAPPAFATPVAPLAAGEVTVQMVSDGGTFRFEPSRITVKVGTAVKWVNASDNRHSATDDPKFEKGPGMAILPVNGVPWSTAFIGNGQEASHLFITPGTYQYFCRNHGQFGMVATITVVR